MKLSTLSEMFELFLTVRVGHHLNLSLEEFRRSWSPELDGAPASHPHSVRYKLKYSSNC